MMVSNQRIIILNNKKYKVFEAKTNEEKQEGLRNHSKLSQDEGMLFYFDPPEDVSMWMKGVNFPLDIIFFNEDQEAISIRRGEPNDENLITVPNTSFVLELNAGSKVKVGDDFEFEEDAPVMKVLFPDGSEQMALYGGERIFSRKNTKILIKKAKKAADSQSDSDYKALGKYMFKCIKIQDERDPEYVESPKKED